MKWQKWMTPLKADCLTDDIWLEGSSPPATVTVFETEQAPSGILGIDGKPLIRKRASIGFVAFDD